MKKILFIFFMCTLLSGCYYSFKTGCFYSPQQVNCYDGVSDINRLQKKDRIGFTNPEQRWKDLEDCGGVRVEDGNFKIFLYRSFKENYKQYQEKYYALFREDREYRKNLKEYAYLDKSYWDKKVIFNDATLGYYTYMSLIYSCMERKEYIELSEIQCYQNKNYCK